MGAPKMRSWKMSALSYRNLIDALVAACAGQGQVAPRKVAAGVWNPNADDPSLDVPDQCVMNDLLRRLSAEDRQVLAKMMAEVYSKSGVHETLEVLYVHRVPPFERSDTKEPPFMTSSGGSPAGSGPRDKRSASPSERGSRLTHTSTRTVDRGAYCPYHRTGVKLPHDFVVTPLRYVD